MRGERESGSVDVGGRGFLWYGLRVLGESLFGVSFLAFLFHLSGRFPEGLMVAAVGAVAGAVMLFAARRAEPES